MFRLPYDMNIGFFFKLIIYGVVINKRTQFSIICLFKIVEVVAVPRLPFHPLNNGLTLQLIMLFTL